MEARKESMKRIAVWGIVSLLLVAACLLVSVSLAQAETVKFRIVGYVNKMEVIPVGDVEGHIIFVVETKGLYFLGDEVAVYSAWSRGEYIKGKGQIQAYSMSTYGDGSTTAVKSQFNVTTAPDGKTALFEDGKGEYIKGTGRFEGIKGTTTFTGKRLTPISLKDNVSRGDLYFDGTVTYTLPPKK